MLLEIDRPGILGEEPMMGSDNSLFVLIPLEPRNKSVKMVAQYFGASSYNYTYSNIYPYTWWLTDANLFDSFQRGLQQRVAEEETL